MGLDRPLLAAVRALSRPDRCNCDLGRSIKTHQTVAELIGERFMPTLLLTVFAMVWSVIVGMGIGIAVGRVARTLAGPAVGMMLAISGISFPGILRSACC